MKFLLPFILVFGFVPGSATAQETGVKNTPSPKDTAVVKEVKKGQLMALETPEMIEETGRSRSNRNTETGDKPYQSVKINEVASMIYKFNPKTEENELGVFKNGKELLPMIFNGDKYGNSMALILGLGGKKGVFDIETEKWIIPIQYTGVSKFNSSAYLVRQGLFYGLVDISNKLIVTIEWDQMWKIDEIDNYAIVMKNRQNGILSITDNKLMTPCVYSSIQAIENATMFKVKKDNTHNIIDINNKPRFKNWYQELYLSSNKRTNYIVKLNDRFGIIDENEKIILPIEYQEIASQPYRDGSYLAKNKKGKYGCVTIDGRITLPFEYDNLTKNYYDNFAVVIKGNKYGLIEVNEGGPYEIAACDFKSITNLGAVFLVEKNQKFRLMDLFGKIVSPVEFDKIETYANEYNIYGGRSKVFIATKDKLQFLVNDRGQPFNDSKYNQISSLYTTTIRDFDGTNKRSGYFVYYKDNKAGVLNSFGQEATSNIFDDILFIDSDDNLIIKQGDKVGYYSLLGKNMIIEPKYDQIFEQKGKMYAQLGNTFYLLTIDKDGKVTETKL